MPVKPNGPTVADGNRSRATSTRFGAIWDGLQKKDTATTYVEPGTPTGYDAQGLTSRPFAHPFYWGGFVYTGL